MTNYTFVSWYFVAIGITLLLIGIISLLAFIISKIDMPYYPHTLIKRVNKKK